MYIKWFVYMMGWLAFSMFTIIIFYEIGERINFEYLMFLPAPFLAWLGVKISRSVWKRNE